MANANLFSLTLYCAGVKRLNVQMDVQAEILQTNVKQMLQSATGMGIWTKRGFSVSYLGISAAFESTFDKSSTHWRRNWTESTTIFLRMGNQSKKHLNDCHR